MRIRNTIFWIGVALLSGCLDPYPLPETDNDSQFLIIDGFLNATDQVVRVKLSRSVNVNETTSSNPETGASVFLEEENGARASLTHSGEGLYEAPFAANSGKKYRIEINTAGKTYFSDFENVTNTPSIDSVVWRPNEQGSSINLFTHDSENNSKYYLWTYEETWEYTAVFYSAFIFNSDKSYTYRQPSDDIFRCWQNRPSTDILIGTTHQLQQDVISNLPIVQIPLDDERLLIKYSILVNQLAISEKAFEFWNQLKKNTESLGSLFDPQPSQVVGNIRGTNGEEALGYFSAGTVAQKRFTVSVYDLPRNYWRLKYKGNCERDTLMLSEIENYDPRTINLVDGIYSMFGQLIGFTHSTHDCTDCILQRGTREKPDFW